MKTKMQWFKNMDDLEIRKEMEQISEENDEDKYNQTHDSEARSDLN